MTEHMAFPFIGRHWFIFLLLSSVCWHTAKAGLIDAGSIAQRDDVQRLQDAGIITANVGTWPLPLAAMRPLMQPLDDPALERARRRLLHQFPSLLHRSAIWGQTDIQAALRPDRWQNFQATPRDSLAASARIKGVEQRWSYRLQGLLPNAPRDQRKLRLDGSYVSHNSGQWQWTLGSPERWWGPAWEGSLLLGRSAYPVPSISLQKQQLQASDSPWLHWLGPWHLVAFAGQLESSRTVPDAKLLGMRVTLQPVPSLTLGLSRTAQWGGKGRPEDFTSFLRLSRGRDNRGSNGVTLANEPGNQIAGLDIRWRSPLGHLPYALYGQIMGEDQTQTNVRFISLPSRTFFLLGGELWWYDQHQHGQRLIVEYTRTNDSERFDRVYEHFVYKDGYRYRDLSIGHGIDNDARLFSVIWLQHGLRNSMQRWRLRWEQLNRGGVKANSVASGPDRIWQLSWWRQSPLSHWGHYQTELTLERGQVHQIDGRVSLSWFFPWQRF